MAAGNHNNSAATAAAVGGGASSSATGKYATIPGGWTAQDFYAAFRVGEDDRHITSIDEDGVALAAIKALHTENRELHQENRGLRQRLTRQDVRLAALEREVAALAAR